MNILAIETTGKYAGVSLAKDECLFTKKNENEMEHLAKILPMAKELLIENKLQIDDIDAMAVSIGPGSFTGMRIGIAFARSIAQAKDIRCIAVNTLEAFTFSKGFEQVDAVFCAPMLDARRGQVYAALYEKKDGQFCDQILSTDIYLLQEYLDKIREIILLGCNEEMKIFFTGDASEKYIKEIENWAHDLSQSSSVKIIAYFENSGEVIQSSENVAKLAKKMYAENMFTDYSELLPNYLRKSEAERKLDKEKQKELEIAADRINI